MSEQERFREFADWGDVVVTVDGRVLKAHEFSFDAKAGIVTVHKAPVGAKLQVTFSPYSTSVSGPVDVRRDDLLVLANQYKRAFTPRPGRKTAQWKRERGAYGQRF